MLTDWNENQAELVGEAVAEPVFSHENHGEEYYRIPLRVLRLSGCSDVVNVLVGRSLIENCPVELGDQVRVEGEVRSFNNKSGQGSRLVISVYARRLEIQEGEHCNRLLLAGVLCKAPVYRKTPLGREICDLMVAVNRRYGRADYLPCIAWGSLAQRCSRLKVGDGIRLSGRLQSRTYNKVVDGVSQQRVAFEVSIMEMEEVETD